MFYFNNQLLLKTKCLWGVFQFNVPLKININTTIETKLTIGITKFFIQILVLKFNFFFCSGNKMMLKLFHYEKRKFFQ